MSETNQNERMVMRLENMGKKEARIFMMEHEQAGTLKQYVKKMYPDCITPVGRVAVFKLCQKFNLF